MSRYVARGKEQLRDLANLVFGLSPDKPWRVEIVPHRAKRSPDQNARLWALYHEIAKGTGHSADEIHEAMKAKFLPPAQVTVKDEVLLVPGSSRKLDVAEFIEFMEQVEAWAATNLGVCLP